MPRRESAHPLFETPSSKTESDPDLLIANPTEGKSEQVSPPLAIPSTARGLEVARGLVQRAERLVLSGALLGEAIEALHRTAKRETVNGPSPWINVDTFRSGARRIESAWLVPQRGGGKMLARALIVGVTSGALTALIAWSPMIPDSLAFHSVSLAVIGAIYVGFGLADGRVSIAVLELSVATAFLVLALLGLWLAPVFVAVGLVLHGFWDLAHRPRGITTKLPSWYPPFCAAFDFVFAGVFLALARKLAASAP